MTKYYDKPTQIGSSISDRISPGQEKIQLWLSQKNGIKVVILNLNNVFFLLCNPSNLVSLELLTDHGIYDNNENKVLYDKKSKEILTYAQP